MERLRQQIQTTAICHAVATVPRPAVLATDCPSTPPMEPPRSTNHLRFRPLASLTTGCTRDVFKTTFLPTRTPTRSCQPSHTWCGTTPATMQWLASPNAKPSVTTRLDWSMAPNASAVMSRISTSLLLQAFRQIQTTRSSIHAASNPRLFPIHNATHPAPPMLNIFADPAI